MAEVIIMAKSKTKRKSGISTQKIFKFIRIGALILPAATTIMGPGTIAQKAVVLKRDYFGVGADGIFNLPNLSRGWMPFLAASAITYGIPKIMGMIRGA